MQSRVFVRSPHVCRIAKAAPNATRSMSFFPGPHFLTRGSFPAGPFASLERDVAPFFRMMDDISRSFDPFTSVQRAAAPAPFQPRFDVREIEGAYELRGELPGVESNNIEVEFTDPQTLVIRGRTESETISGTPSSTVEASQQTTAAVEAAESTSTNAVADDAASTHSTSSYQKATVEDDGAAETATSTPGQVTPAESTVSEAQQPTAEHSNAQSTTNSETNNKYTRYWVSERRTGSFQRVFSFPTKIDQEAVKASLRNGVLNLVVPKAIAQQPKKIEVQ